MLITNGEKTLNIENENHISAFLSEGWAEVKEESKEEQKKAKPRVPRKTKKD